VGWYDRTKGAWIASNNGRVIQILNIDNGLAILDVDGYGRAASTWRLSELGITDAERQQLATLYTPDKSLWRAPIAHFTPWDLNWPSGPPEDAQRPTPPDPETPDDYTPSEPCEQSGCIIEAESQVLGERIGISGTPFTLNYRSDRVLGRKTPYILNIPLREQSVPGSLKEILLNISIAGREFKYRFSPETRNTTFVWDGLDAFGRRVLGRQEAYVRIGYRYKIVKYDSPAKMEQSFARVGESVLGNARARRQLSITLWKRHTQDLGTWYPYGTGLGSLTLNVHHLYNPIPKILYQGNGQERGTTANRVNGLILETIAGNNFQGYSGDGGLATEALLFHPYDLAFGPDGLLYIADTYNHCIRRINEDGTISTIAGNGSPYFSGDGGLASEAEFHYPSGLAFAPDGSLYIADESNHRIRRISVDGIVTTVAGRHFGFDGDGGPATSALLADPSNIAFDSEGNLYIADTFNHRIRHLSVNGIITTIAGSGQTGYFGGGFSGDYWRATEAELNKPEGIALSPDGSLYIADRNNQRIRRVNVEGIIETVAGNDERNYDCNEGLATAVYLSYVEQITVSPDGQLYIASNRCIRRVQEDGTIHKVAGNKASSGNHLDGGLATTTSLSNPKGMTFGPDGHLYFIDSNRVRRIRPAFPGFSIGNITMPSEDGSLIYEFTPSGRHMTTADSLTGQVLYRFSYTDKGYLKEIKDLDGDITRIERNGNTPVTIIAPDGQRTALTLDDKGYLNSVTNPAGEAYQLQYTADGLLTAFIDPRGHKSVYQYDDLGRFVEDTNAAGGGWTLARSENSGGGYTTTMTTKEGRVTQYQVKPQDNGEMLRVNTSPDGTVSKTFINASGETTVTRPDGTVIVSEQGPDPRFGMQAPFTKRMTITTPNGLSGVVTTEKTVKLADVADPLSLLSLTTEITTNDRTSQSVYDATNKMLTGLSAAGRQSVSILDEKGRVIQEQVPGLADVFYTYDNRGRLTQVTEGEGDEARTSTLSYDDKGYLDKLTDVLGRDTQFDYDAVGRVTKQILPDGRQINYSYDANGNVTAITPPSRPVHGFEYTEVDLQKQYTPPTLTGLEQPQTQYAYNLDKQLVKIQRPDGQVIDFVYDDDKKRLNGINLPGEQSISYAYHENTGKLKTLTDTEGSTLSYTYDGSLPLSETWGNGDITGTLSLSYDNHFQVTKLSLNGNVVNYEYDVDGQITKAGNLGLTHNEQNGLFTGTQLGNLTTQRTHNIFGEIASETASYNSNTLYRTEYQRDQLGRITQKLETLEGITTTFDYRYDVAGRLVEVKQNGVIVEAYTYDENGNRLSADTTHGSVKGQYDAQDRLTQYGDNSYDYTENGELRRKNSNGQITQYQYDVFGNLRSVQLPDGKQIEYVIDGRNRRVGKKINGQLVQGFLYQGSLNPVAELDGEGNVVSRFVYGSKANIPDYMLKNGNTYRILSDHLGNPRLVVDISEGTVAQRMDYDAFGNVVFDSNPGFQPFGFAGGIYDRDTQFTRFGARDYDVKTGRWTAKDPIRFDGGVNLYGYALNNPISLYDLNGLGFKSPGEFGHGNLVIHEGVQIGGYIIDLPNGSIDTGLNNNLPIGSDMDFFYVNDQWYKIKHGTVHLYLDDCGKVRIEAEQGAAMVYPIDQPPLFWYYYDGNKPQDYINDLDKNPKYGPLPGTPVPRFK
ncbi:MAG: RHS repeat-associated core domain-containing protein, partial [Candidatus Parabeggiatoa sp.]|nr:RHS repeat-associated core domain-containing protein [Candidatus Parabeggiatoa sp.]